MKSLLPSFLSYLYPLASAKKWEKCFAFALVSFVLLFIPVQHLHQNWQQLQQTKQEWQKLQSQLSQLQQTYFSQKRHDNAKLNQTSQTTITDFLLHQKTQLHITQMHWETDSPYLILAVEANYGQIIEFIHLMNKNFPNLCLSQLKIQKKTLNEQRKNFSELRGVINLLVIKMIWRLQLTAN